ncbi:MAG: glycosyltransferase [Proteobacteria bacterium]|nr:glycosyltransferase [Pseudomonadota bacterium]
MPRELAPVSVVIAAYNAAGVIGRALASIAKQTRLPAEVIVVDDGSADGTADAAQSYSDRLLPARLVIIRQPNKGAGAARNAGVVGATQEYLAFLDADDEWLPAKIERSMQVIAETGADMIAHDYLVDDGARDVHVRCHERSVMGSDPYTSLYVRGYIPSISVVTRRALTLAVGGFDESLRNAQDFELWLALLRDPKVRFTMFGEALAKYHRTPGGLMTVTDRRLKCCELIAIRYLPYLRLNRFRAFLAFWTRIVVIYGEAIRANRRHALRYAVTFAVRLIALSIQAMLNSSSTTPRRDLHAAMND